MHGVAARPSHPQALPRLTVCCNMSRSILVLIRNGALPTVPKVQDQAAGLTANINESRIRIASRN